MPHYLEALRDIRHGDHRTRLEWRGRFDRNIFQCCEQSPTRRNSGSLAPDCQRVCYPVAANRHFKTTVKEFTKSGNIHGFLATPSAGTSENAEATEQHGNVPVVPPTASASCFSGGSEFTDSKYKLDADVNLITGHSRCTAPWAISERRSSIARRRPRLRS
jgi:hypothetical protein